MSRVRDFKLPDLGEGLTEGEILQWLVKVGDTVTLNQPIVEVETAKAAVEVPSPYAGVVAELLYDEGATVDVGRPIITFDVDDAATTPDAAVPAAGATEGESAVAGEERQSVLVGYGPREGSGRRRRSRPAAVVAAEPPAPRRGLEQAERGSGAAVATAAEAAVLAKPPVRKLARDLGVDLRSVSGTGPEGVITRDDVQSAAGGAAPLRAVPAAGDERIPIRGVRKAMAAAVTASAFTAPHVTEFLTVDVTESMALLERLAGAPEFAELRPSPLLLAARALLVGVRRHPLINSSWDEQRQEVVVHGDVNLGIAAATPRGLLVPNVKAAQRLSLAELAQALADLARTAREGKTAPADMQRGTITITNVGVFGVDNGTPILTPGEAAILCLGAVRDMPWVHEGEIAVRKVTQLALSFDHRLVDGELGSRFLADVGAMLRDPSLLLAWS
jgi:pyruvate dehydrogenase E2 component (dihydrolipoamide acetyltransferase)